MPLGRATGRAETTKTMKKTRKSYHVALVGVGAVGVEMLRVLRQRRFPMASLRVLATRPRRETIDGKPYQVEKATPESFRGVDLALFAGGEEPEGHLGWPAVEAGAVVVDNGPVYRLYPNVPLVVPEVNAHVLQGDARLIANPNCSTIQLVVVLKPLYDQARMKRVVVSTYQAVSGKGSAAKVQLAKEWKHAAAGNPPPKETCFTRPIADNVIPHIDRFSADGYTLEETKLLHETRKIMGDDHLQVTATAVRVPVMNGHSESVNIEFHSALSAADARKVLRAAPGIKVQDDPGRNLYPVPFEVSGADDVYVGRIRQDRSVPYGLNLWIVADNIRKGAALNAVQIAEKLAEFGKL